MTQGLSSVCNGSASLKNYLSTEHKEPYILIAVGIIMAIGGLIAAGCFYANIGNYAFAIAGGGVGIGAIFILIAGLRREKPIQPSQQEIPKTTTPVLPPTLAIEPQTTQYDHSTMTFFKWKDENYSTGVSTPQLWEEDLQAHGIQPLDGDKLILEGASSWLSLPKFHFFAISQRVPLEVLVPATEKYKKGRDLIWIILYGIHRDESPDYVEDTSLFDQQRDGWEDIHSGFRNVRKLLWWCYYRDTERLVDPARYAQQLRDVAEQYYKT